MTTLTQYDKFWNCPLQVKQDFEDWYMESIQCTNDPTEREQFFEQSEYTLVYCNIEVFRTWMAWRTAYSKYVTPEPSNVT